MRKMILTITRKNNKFMSASITDVKELKKMIEGLKTVLEDDELEEFEELFNTKNATTLVESCNKMLPQVMEELKDELPEMYRQLRDIETTYYVVSKKRISAMLEILEKGHK